ncbi:MAG TPA: prolipoprotein diacylglyceryl transferase family protein [Gemmatimonadaceae bacterium]|nr:prolipoprotein diacylglyceryl transferase family protein [Gemmatimonadaceae bacterium]
MIAPYAVFFTSACVLLLVLIWREAMRRGFAPEQVAAAMAACTLGAIAGARLLMFDFHAPAYGEKTVLGAMAGGMLTLLIVRRVLGFDRRALDVPVIPALWAAAVGRVGCLLAGCCHGIATSAPWGIRYADGPASGGVAVHPTQMYEAVGDIVVALLLTRHRNRFSRPGSLALAGIAGFALIRFAVEPLRASAVVSGSLTTVQWTLVAVVTVVALSAMSRRLWAESRGLRAEGRKPKAESLPRAAILVAAVIASVAIGDAWFTPLERMIVETTAFVAAMVVVAQHTRVSTLRLTPTLGLVAAMPLQVADRPDSTTRYWAIGGGGFAGGYEVTTEDCEGNTVSRTQHKYQVASASAEYRQENAAGQGFGVRLSGFTGTDNSPGERNYGSIPGDPFRFADRRDAIQGGSVLLSVDGKQGGVRIGVTAGQWNLKGDYPIYDNGSVRQRVHPIGGLRLGSTKRTHGEISVATGMAPGPTPLVRLGVAIPDSAGRNLLRLGISDGGGYIGGQILTPGNFEIEPFAIVGGSTMYQAGIGLKRRFYLKPATK